MVADAELHVAGVQVLPDLQWVLLILLHLLDLPYVLILRLLPFFVLSRSFGPLPPQDPVSPGRFPFLRADTVGAETLSSEE